MCKAILQFVFSWADIFQSNVEFKKRFFKEYSEEEKLDPPENKPGMIDKMLYR